MDETPIQCAEKIHGWMGRNELAWLQAKAAGLQADDVWVEIGCWAGRSLTCVGMSLPPRAKLYAVDPVVGVPTLPDDKTSIAYNSLLEVVDRLRRLTNVDVQFLEMPSVEAARLLCDGSCAVVFIDGNHEHDAVLSDIEAWLPKMRPNGLICGHDGTREEVRTAVDSALGTVEMHESIWSKKLDG